MSSLRIIEQENDHYFLQMKIRSEITVINLTDMKKIWQIVLSENEAIQKFKDDNPLIQSSNKWIAEYVATMLKNLKTDIKITVTEPDISINFSSHVSSLSIKLNLLLQLQSSDLVYKEITLPLLMVINELKFREEKLLSILKAKDVEIKEFKFEGASITRRNAITEPYNAVNFEMECQSSLTKRAEHILKNPCSVFSPALNTLYTEFSSLAANMSLSKEEKVGNESTVSHDQDSSSVVENSVSNDKVRKENDIELKRKVSESLRRTKRPKKTYKI